MTVVSHYELTYILERDPEENLQIVKIYKRNEIPLNLGIIKIIHKRGTPIMITEHYEAEDISADFGDCEG